MKTRIKFPLMMLALLCLCQTAFAAAYFTGNLTSAQEVPPNGSTATGFGRVTLNDAETQISVSVHWSGLTGNASAGHIHGPAAVGANAPVLFNLAPSAVTSGSVIGATFAVTPTQVANLKAGLWYFNIHTAANPGGEIRGQITVDAPYLVSMSGRQENPAVTTAATGSGVVSINAAGTQALVTMNWAGLSGNATAGHVHSGRSGVNGPIVCNLSPPAAATGSVTDFLCTFSPAQITSLRQGQFYLNVHTAANPGGEVRGQIQRRRSTVLDFDGDSKTDFAVARNNSPSAGLIEWFILNSATSSFSATQWGQSSTDFSNQRLLAGDFDGDGKDDITVWRAATDANFFILLSSNNTLRVEQFGSTGDDPRMINDYDGDGRTDPAVWRGGNPAFLYYRPSANNPPGSFVGVAFGQTGDFPNPGDFDGDGRGDICVQRSTQFLCQMTTQGFRVFNWGLSSDFGVPGDYDGDGKTDINVVRTVGANRVWFPLRSLDGQFQQITWGASTAARTQGDYDGDGKTDVAVWQATGGVQTYWVLPSNGSPFFSQAWGTTGDLSVNAYNVR